jgi:hypothetical protein
VAPPLSFEKIPRGIEAMDMSRVKIPWGIVPMDKAFVAIPWGFLAKDTSFVVISWGIVPISGGRRYPYGLWIERLVDPLFHVHQMRLGGGVEARGQGEPLRQPVAHVPELGPGQGAGVAGHVLRRLDHEGDQAVEPGALEAAA